MNRRTTDGQASRFANQRIAAVIALAVVLGAVSAPPAGAQDQPAKLSAIAGEWRASIVANGVEVPFRFEIVTRGEAPVASFFNGERRISSTGGRVKDDRVHFVFGQYAATLDLSLSAGQLSGEYRRGTRAPYPFKATRPPASPPAAASASPRPARRRSRAHGSCRPRARKGRPPGGSSPERTAGSCRRRSCASTATPAR